MEKKIKKVFIDGPITPSFIGDAIAKHSEKKEIGAHSIFLGQVRNDKAGDQVVKAIEYTTYRDMADRVITEIREAAFEKYQLNCLHIYHSLGVVEAGAISLFIFTSSKHRKDAIEACDYLVNRIKKEAPVWGKELYESDGYAWKVNT